MIFGMLFFFIFTCHIGEMCPYGNGKTDEKTIVQMLYWHIDG